MSVTKFPAPAWRDRLQITSTGTYRANLHNSELATSAFLPDLHYDEFRMQLRLSGRTPWGHIKEERLWSDDDERRLAIALQASDIQVGTDIASQAAYAVAHSRTKHPLREWLAGLYWDGFPRIDKWLMHYMGAADTNYTKAVGACWLISAVARIMRPGCKADCMLIFEGDEGIKKSTALNALGGEFFTDELADISNTGGAKDAAMQMQGAWIIEMAELDTIGKADFSRIKSFLSRRIDRFRPSYGRNVVERPRQCVFGGTINPPYVLPDEEGRRRFWIVEVTQCNSDGISEDRDQLFAEAMVRLNAGIPWWLVDDDIVKVARDKAEDRTIYDAWEPKISKFLEKLSSTTTGNILEDALLIPPGKWTPGDQRRAGRVMARMSGWEKRKVRYGKRLVWEFVRR